MLTAKEAKIEIEKIIVGLGEFCAHTKTLGPEVSDEQKSSIAEEELSSRLAYLVENFSYIT